MTDFPSQHLDPGSLARPWIAGFVFLVAGLLLVAVAIRLGS